MTVNMIAHIVFPAREGREKIEIRKVTGVKIESGWEMLTGIATILLAKNVTFFDKQKVKEVFKKGDKVEIYLGYDFTYIKEFEGYITDVSADVPIQIKCEDAMYLLKRHPVNISLKETSISGLLEKILPNGFKFDALDAQIGSVRYPRASVSKVLEELRDDGIYSYIKNHDTLVCGKIYQDDENDAPIKFSTSRNVAENNLKYKSKEDNLIKVVAVSTLKNGDKIEVEVGDEDGVVNQLPFYGITSKTELKKLAQLDYNKFKVDGLEGSFTAFGIPSITHGKKVDWENTLYPEQNGIYYVKKVVKIYEESPRYRQIITLDRKAV